VIDDLNMGRCLRGNSRSEWKNSRGTEGISAPSKSINAAICHNLGRVLPSGPSVENQELVA
jgi:hypothetical protein